uniref:Uncharacterized protein n=1 Tax=Chromera velia CCMP2878 TaxID=1169474 RepID=A0A0G4GGK5_9ALVE|eukprot:Cvel_4676.t1-p1 / transcript=Cvel_4676.t1 / gene=Cvel_4676 / organism=Chromera_velia_CCMP2878 / gene_product=hypothetical protein / transcript_product=hypothetical protein / location=Cvel_scaffold207:29496-36110(-) / protein_length=921 / sequence_SO=supercontig / SO=protein_coding / is_pseudo=false
MFQQRVLDPGSPQRSEKIFEVIVLEELPRELRERFYDFIVKRNVQFSKQKDGNFAAVVRLEDVPPESLQKSESVQKGSGGSGGALPRRRADFMKSRGGPVRSRPQTAKTKGKGVRRGEGPTEREEGTGAGQGKNGKGRFDRAERLRQASRDALAEVERPGIPSFSRQLLGGSVNEGKNPGCPCSPGRMAGVPTFAYSCGFYWERYARVATQLARLAEERPTRPTSSKKGGGAVLMERELRQRPLGELRRLCASLYDLRFEKDKEHLRGSAKQKEAGTKMLQEREQRDEEGGTPPPACQKRGRRCGVDFAVDPAVLRCTPPFPLFVLGTLEKKFGRGELFRREEAYDSSDLLFFLYTRATAIQVMMRPVARTGAEDRDMWLRNETERAPPKPRGGVPNRRRPESAKQAGASGGPGGDGPLLDVRMSIDISRACFGDSPKQEPLLLAFLRALDSLISFEPPPSAKGARKKTSAEDLRIGLFSFLAAAVKEFHTARVPLGIAPPPVFSLSLPLPISMPSEGIPPFSGRPSEGRVAGEGEGLTEGLSSPFEGPFSKGLSFKDLDLGVAGSSGRGLGGFTELLKSLGVNWDAEKDAQASGCPLVGKPMGMTADVEGVRDEETEIQRQEARLMAALHITPSEAHTGGATFGTAGALPAPSGDMPGPSPPSASSHISRATVRAWAEETVQRRIELRDRVDANWKSIAPFDRPSSPLRRQAPSSEGARGPAGVSPHPPLSVPSTLHKGPASGTPMDLTQRLGVALSSPAGVSALPPAVPSTNAAAGTRGQEEGAAPRMPTEEPPLPSSSVALAISHCPSCVPTSLGLEVVNPPLDATPKIHTQGERAKELVEYSAVQEAVSSSSTAVAGPASSSHERPREGQPMKGSNDSVPVPAVSPGNGGPISAILESVQQARRQIEINRGNMRGAS